MQVLLKEKQEALQKNNENLQTYRHAVDEDERKSLQHGMTIAQRRKELSSLCAKARNDYSRKEIKRDFKAGLRVGSLIILPCCSFFLTIEAYPVQLQALGNIYSVLYCYICKIFTQYSLFHI